MSLKPPELSGRGGKKKEKRQNHWNHLAFNSARINIEVQLLSSSHGRALTLKLHCLRRNLMTSPSRADGMESHLWADERTNPQSGCKNMANDGPGTRSTREHVGRVHGRVKKSQVGQKIMGAVEISDR